jgi:hypothetical protein
MRGPDDSIPAVVARLIDVLESSGVDSTFGGAIALAAWSEPRATADVDVVLWLDPIAEIDRAIALVRSAARKTSGSRSGTRSVLESGEGAFWSRP